MADTNQEKSHVPEEMGTLFIMDLLRQKREKALREKKDAMINKMAAEQKKKMAEGRKEPSSNLYTPGGFVGIGALTSGSPKWNAGKRRQVENEDDKPHAVQSDNEMFILGLLKEQSQEIKDRDHKEVSEEGLACASDVNYRKKFER
ncbi:uncharacterized protein LOC111717923 [Eurytemora carolleeae]|uniref:uncharacterized protein LOC111717923 n=1 Tax=Eurytemora carolleeae TaxID=1294199 RepID=UPI000C7688EC|nr:uncharacterized protein LOC111717923 [Eurytemora carolleeae]|eukprot:XP_023349159.1 uncharacterized protein LOC111717923 [Eurytemora affinis]